MTGDGAASLAMGRLLADRYDAVRIINLPNRADRRDEMRGELARIGLEIDGNHLAFHPASRPETPGDFPSIGARGCFQSHLAILKEARERGWGNLLILEDDVDFARDIDVLLPPVLDRLDAQSGWSIFYGGFGDWPGKDRKGPIVPAAPEEAIGCTHFMGFRREAVDRLIPYLEAMLARPAGSPEGGPMHVDGAYSWFRAANPDMLTLVAQPVLGHQRPSRTDIHDLTLIDRLPVVRSVMAALRRARRASQARKQAHN